MVLGTLQVPACRWPTNPRALVGEIGGMERWPKAGPGYSKKSLNVLRFDLLLYTGTGKDECTFFFFSFSLFLFFSTKPNRYADLTDRAAQNNR